MLRGESEWSGVVDAFGGAALGGDWAAALNALADACGADRGELIGVGADTAVPFNWITRVDPVITEEFERLGGGDPTINPRVRVGVRAPILQSWHDVQCSTEEELRRNFVYADLCRRWDIPHGSQTTLMREDGMLIGLAVLRSQRAGPPQGAERSNFESLAPHVRSAVLTQMALEGHGAALISGAMEALGVAAFVLDGLGRVRALTPAAEARLHENGLRLSQGRLGAAGADARQLTDAIAQASAGVTVGGGPASRTVVIRTGEGPAELEVLDVVSLPQRPYGFGFQPRVLVVVRGAERARTDVARVLAQAFSLTPAETEIAMALAAGESRDAIAERRQASIETIRSQIKTVFAKLGVRRESQLLSRLRRFV